MPRSEVIKRDLDLVGNLPIMDDGVVKNAVRAGGITKISDLEIFVTFSADSVLSRQQIEGIRIQIKTELWKKFKGYPISVKMVQVPAGRNEAEQFRFVQKFMTEKAKPVSAFQFVAFPFSSRSQGEPICVKAKLNGILGTR